MSRRCRIVLLLLCGPALLGLGAWFLLLPLWARHHFRAAEAALDRLDFDEAREHLDRCLRFSPEDPAAHLLAAQAARRAGALEDANRHLRAAGRLPGVNRDGLVLEQALLTSQRDGPGVVDALLNALLGGKGPEVPLVLEALAEANQAAGRRDEALACLDDLLRRRPGHHRALATRGRLWAELKQWDRAVADFRRSLDLRPEADGTRLRLAEALDRLGQTLEATGHYEWLRRRQPDRAEVVIGLARCRQDLAEVDEAELLLDAFLAREPRHPAALLERGRVALRKGQPEGAEAWFRRAVDGAPRDADAWRLLTLCLEAQGKAGDATACREQLTRLERDAAGEERWRTQITAAPDDPAPRYQLGMLLLGVGQEEEGLRWLSSVLAIDPRHGPARQALADHHRQAEGWGR
jgi:tetratricopeptide (TPR) repeat protein